METAIKTMVIGVAACACAFAAPAFAYTLTGTIPGVIRGQQPKHVAINLQKPPSSAAYLKLTLSSPLVNAGVGYSVDFCVAPASAPVTHPCSTPANVGSGFLVVPGQQAIVFVHPNVYPNNVIWVGQGTFVAVPYSLEVDYVP
jgi:hypothetical protein